MAVVGAPGPASGVLALMAPLSSMLAPPSVRLLGCRAGMVGAVEPLAAPAVVAPPAAWGVLLVAAPTTVAPPAVGLPGMPPPGGPNMSGVTGVGVVVVLAVGVVLVALAVSVARSFWASA